MSTPRIRKRTTGTYALEALAYDSDDAACDMTGTLGITISDGAGTTVHSGTPTTATTGATFACDVTELPYLDVYTAVWTGDVEAAAQEFTTRFELVGDYLFETADLRAYDTAYADTTKYPTTKLRLARTWVEERIEHAAGVSFVPRGARERVFADGCTMLRLAWPRIRAVRSVSVDGTALTSTQLAELVLHHRAVEWSTGWTKGALVEIHYEHGYDGPPAPVTEAGLILAREYLVAKSLSSRATVESTDVGFFRLSIAGAGGRTGVPEVDAVIADFGEHGWIG